MPINALISRGGVPLDLTDTMVRGRALQQRDTALAQDQQAMDFRQEQIRNALAAQEEDDAEWDQALSAKDWTRMAAIDPQATRVLWDVEQAQPAPAKPDYRTVGGALVEITDEGPREVYRPAQRESSAVGGAASARPQLVEVTLPDGTTQKQWVSPGQSTGVPVGAPAKPKAPQGSGVTVGPNGELIVDTKASEGERVSAGYLGRMREASAGLSDPSLANYVPSTPAFMAFASLLDDETGVIGGTLANWTLNDIDRQYLGNALDFILAKMRKESGATIKGGEFRKEYINYFPMPDDSPKVREDKARKRQTAMRQLEISAGRAEPAASKPTEPKANIPPPAALKKLQEGKVTTFANGQQWTLRNGQAIQVK